MKKNYKVIKSVLLKNNNIYKEFTKDLKEDIQVIKILSQLSEESNKELIFLSMIPPELHHLDEIRQIIINHPYNNPYCQSHWKYDKQVIIECFKKASHFTNDLDQFLDDAEIMLEVVSYHPYLILSLNNLLLNEDFLFQLVEKNHKVLVTINGYWMLNVPRIKKFELLFNSKRICMLVLKKRLNFFHLFNDNIRNDFEIYITFKRMYLQFYSKRMNKLMNCNFIFK